MAVNKNFVADSNEEFTYLISILPESVKAIRSPRYGVTPEDILASIWKNVTQRDALKDLGLPPNDNGLSQFLADSCDVDVRHIKGPGASTLKGKLVIWVRNHMRENAVNSMSPSSTNRKVSSERQRMTATELFTELNRQNLLLRSVKESDIANVVNSLKKRTATI